MGKLTEAHWSIGLLGVQLILAVVAVILSPTLRQALLDGLPFIGAFVLGVAVGGAIFGSSGKRGDK
jgi:hypothetical protein